MKSKKESSFINIFIYLLIVIFIILIALPPICRVVFKESTDNINNGSNASVSNVMALNCNKEVIVDNVTYNVTISSNYTDDELTKVTFMYDLPEISDSGIVVNPLITEIDTIRNSGIVEDQSTDTQARFVLTKELKEANPDNTSLDSYFQPKDLQQSNLESLGYTCSTLTA